MLDSLHHLIKHVAPSVCTQLADQKQASSWSSKDKLSAPVIFDSVGKQYVAVFNQSIVRLWESVEVDLNKVKKLKVCALEKT